MKIISWNIKHNHLNPIEKIKELFESYPADIYCFQEVNNDVLDFFKTQHQFQMHHEKEFSKIDTLSESSKSDNGLGIKNSLKQTNKEKYSHLVILSKYVIQNTGHVHIVEPNKPISKISKKLQKYSKIFENYIAEYAPYIDIKRLEDHKQFRIFNLHLKRFTTPNNRIHQFKKVIHQMDRTKENIICGDFNILDSFLGKLSGTFFNSSLKDNFKFNERKHFNKLFKIHKFVNPFSKQVTFDYKYLLGLQLDHILIPEHANIYDKKVLDIKQYQSDHAPIYIEID